MELRMKLCPHDDGDAISKVMKTTRILAFVLKMNEPQSYPRDIVKILNVLRGKTTMEGVKRFGSNYKLRMNRRRQG